MRDSVSVAVFEGSGPLSLSPGFQPNASERQLRVRGAFGLQSLVCVCMMNAFGEDSFQIATRMLLWRSVAPSGYVPALVEHVPVDSTR